MSRWRDGTDVPELVRPAWWRELLNRVWPTYVVVVFNHEDYTGNFQQHVHLTVAAAKRALLEQARRHVEEQVVLHHLANLPITSDSIERLQLYCVIQPLGYAPPKQIEPEQPWPRQ